MRYTSTRDGSVDTDSASAVIDGAPADGGLYVPESFPKLDYREFFGLDYIGCADKVLRAYFDFDVTGIAADAYGTFDTDEPAPTVKLDDRLYVLELWHGETHSAKDIALSVLPRLFVRAKAERGSTDKTLILVATGGNTGKAALEGFKNADGTEVCAFYPTDGVSRVQRLAMQTQDGDNTCAVGVSGSFDEVQTAVKAALHSDGLKQALADNNISMSSANSINIGQFVPRIAYYYSAYADLVGSGEIKSGDRVDFIVPTGGFCDILAGWYAYKMGLPINKLVCASNSNNVLTDFIETGMYDINRELYRTASPSMDVLISGNLERLIFETSGRNAELTASRMTELNKSGRYSVSHDEIDKIREVFACDYADDEDIESAIADMFDEYGYLIDPHTAVAYSVAARRELVRPTIVVSTVNPYKFAPAVLRALGEKAGSEATSDMLRKMEELTAMDAPQSLLDVFSAEVRFNDTVAPSDISDYISTRYGKK